MTNETSSLLIHSGAELRSVEESGGRKIRGIAVPFNKPSLEFQIAGRRVREKVDPQASIEELDNVYAVHGHKTENVLGRVSRNTMTVTRSAEGLRFEVDLPDTTWGNDVYESVRRGDIQGASIKMSNVRSTFKRMLDGVYERSINAMRMHHIALVAEPAYPDAYVELRSADYLKDIEEFDLSRNRTEELNSQIEEYNSRIASITGGQ